MKPFLADRVAEATGQSSAEKQTWIRELQVLTNELILLEIECFDLRAQIYPRGSTDRLAAASQMKKVIDDAVLRIGGNDEARPKLETARVQSHYLSQQYPQAITLAKELWIKSNQDNLRAQLASLAIMASCEAEDLKTAEEWIERAGSWKTSPYLAIARLEYLLTQLRLQNRGKSGEELPVRQSRSASISKFDRHQFRPLLVAAFGSLDRKSHLAIQLEDNVRFTGNEKRCFSSTHSDSSQTTFSGLEVARGDCGTRKSQSICHRNVKIKPPFNLDLRLEHFTIDSNGRSTPFSPSLRLPSPCRRTLRRPRYICLGVGHWPRPSKPWEKRRRWSRQLPKKPKETIESLCSDTWSNGPIRSQLYLPADGSMNACCAMTTCLVPPSFG